MAVRSTAAGTAPFVLLVSCLSVSFMAQALPDQITAAGSLDATARQLFSISNLGALKLAVQDKMAFQSQGARKLLAQDQFVTLRPKCEWLDADSDDPWCSPMLENWLQYSGTPSSPHRSAALMADARYTYCSETHKNKAACMGDQAHRCYWSPARDGRPAVCRGADAMEMVYYASNNFTATPYTIPAALTCPGTKAYEFYSCFARPDASTPDSCKQVPNCHSATLDGDSNVCLPNSMKAYSQAQFDNFWKGLEELRPDVYGKCAGACWIRQAKVCLTKAAKAGCDALAFCSWDSVAKVCLHNTLEFENEYDNKVRRLYGACVQIDNKKDCEANKDATSSVQTEAAAAWLKYKPSSQEVNCKLA